jgi:hypothetical protein
MLNEDQIIKKLYNQAGIFKEHMMRKEYPEAVLCADRVSMVILRLDADERIRKEIFGERDKNNPVTGLIDEGQYIKALDWCIYHGFHYAVHMFENVMKKEH